MTTTRGPRTPPPTGRPASRPGGKQPDRAPAAAFVGVRRLFAAETGTYFLLLGTTIFLVAFGLVMVLSSSSVESQAADESAFASVTRQALYALIAVPLMLVASRMPITFWKRWAWPAVVAGMLLQLLVFTPLGWGYGGNRNWLRIGESFTAQPSEIVKLTLILWIAALLVSKAGLLEEWRHVLIPIGPVAGLAIGLVLLGNDLGTAVVMFLIVFGLLFYAGIRLKFLGVAALVIGAFGLVFAFAGSSRTARIQSWLNGCSPEDYETWCWQPTHGLWALASGGLFGVGLGGSKAKWSWLPEADNDFIFAIIGEELGLVGAIVVLLLFVVLAVAFMRVIRHNADPFARIVTSGVMVWIVGQAFINIGVVLGVLPVLGVPLPLVSAGGSALISTLLAIGVVLSFARNTTTTRPVQVEQSPAERSRLLAQQRVSQQRSTQPGTGGRP